MKEISPLCDIALPGYGATPSEINSYVGCIQMEVIDELLENTSDVTIDVEEPKVEKKLDAINEDPEVNDYEKIDEDLEELTPKKDVEKTEYEKVEDDDTLENDLFDLIDSMYDNREDGDI